MLAIILRKCPLVKAIRTVCTARAMAEMPIIACDIESASFPVAELGED